MKPRCLESTVLQPLLATVCMSTLPARVCEHNPNGNFNDRNTHVSRK